MKTLTSVWLAQARPNNYKHNTLYVLSVQSTVRLHEQVNGILETYRYVMKAGI